MRNVADPHNTKWLLFAIFIPMLETVYIVQRVEICHKAFIFRALYLNLLEYVHKPCFLYVIN